MKLSQIVDSNTHAIISKAIESAKEVNIPVLVFNEIPTADKTLAFSSTYVLLMEGRWYDMDDWKSLSANFKAPNWTLSDNIRSSTFLSPYINLPERLGNVLEVPKSLLNQFHEETTAYVMEITGESIMSDASKPSKPSKPFLTVIVWGGRTHKFTKEELQDMLDNLDRFYDADNLVKWLRNSTGIHESWRLALTLNRYIEMQTPFTIDLRD